jgi:hypothetical protein
MKSANLEKYKKKDNQILCFFKNPLYQKDKITLYKFNISKNIMIISKKI